MFCKNTFKEILEFITLVAIASLILRVRYVAL